MNTTKRVTVFGMGYVGCVTAACLSRDGFEVIGVDVDDRKISALRKGQSPVTEPGLQELISQQVVQNRLTCTSDAAMAIQQSDLALIAVGTPSESNGSVDTKAIEYVIETIGNVIRKTGQGYSVVIRSTLLPGILEETLTPLLENSAERELGDDLRIYNNPEFLRETTAIHDYDNPPFVLVGASEPCHAAWVFDLYSRVDADCISTDTRTAALVKYACNAFHALKIDFANEIGTLARAFGASGLHVMDLLCRDERLNISKAYLRPGFAFGGSCLPKDVRALTRFAQQEAIQTDLLDAILPSNEAHLARALQVIRATGCRKIGLAGLSFKAGSDDLRESPHVRLAETLHGHGYELSIYDPHVRPAHLLGKNLAYIDQHLPHLGALLVHDVDAFYRHAELLVIASDVADQLDWTDSFFGEVIDLRHELVVPNQAVAVV